MHTITGTTQNSSNIGDTWSVGVSGLVVPAADRCFSACVPRAPSVLTATLRSGGHYQLFLSTGRLSLEANHLGQLMQPLKISLLTRALQSLMGWGGCLIRRTPVCGCPGGGAELFPRALVPSWPRCCLFLVPTPPCPLPHSFPGVEEEVRPLWDVW